ncbi:uncharacterized protein Hqrw_5078 (plasmid) [Haloquadratum walsbyi C23]|uniref:Uncharacterized protein n=2 Tax=Haloquadratum walsbyi TaxID=293091 RepID=G0LNE4_HALWC|nr:uncharacterized protein Hqrw_5078 [Haloquadratum walsbyi C23]
MSVNIDGDSISPSSSCTTDVIKQLISKIHEQHQTIDSLESEISDIRDQLATRAKSDAIDKKQISEQEERISELEDKTDDSETSKDQSSTSDSEGEDTNTQSTALEQVVALPDDVATENLTSNQKRARSIARRIDEYGKSVPAGIAITSTRIRDILSGLEDKRIHRQTVQRVADFLKRFGDCEIDTKETRGGKDVVVFSESVVEDITSVVTGTKDLGVTPAII